MDRRASYASIIVLASLLLLISSCKEERRQAGSTNQLTGTYAGKFPCGVCNGIAFTLTLREKGIYFLRTEFHDHPSVGGKKFDELGRWSITGDTLKMRSRGEFDVRFLVTDEGDLQLLEHEGRSVANDTRYALQRTDAEPFEPRMILYGIYSNGEKGEEGIFAECITGLQLPVLAEGEGSKLDSAYSAANTTAGAFASFEGKIVRRETTGGTRDVVIVERFNSLAPGATCALLANVPGSLLADAGGGERPLHRHRLSRLAQVLHVRLKPLELEAAGHLVGG